jgi:glutamate 5-kinase
MKREDLKHTRRWVIKVGSSLVTAQGQGLDQDALADWCQQIATLKARGVQVVLVSSGAVAEGMARLGFKQRPDDMASLQATAAVGQMGLIRAYEGHFAEHGLRAAQILLTHDDIENRDRYLNARNTLIRLLELGVVPVVNENDTIATDEIRLGDNDTLGALTANLIDAEVLVLLTDQAGLFDSDPRENPEAKLRHSADLADPQLIGMVGTSKGSLGRGGMRTKLFAAHTAARSGAVTVIAHGRHPEALLNIHDGETLGTLFTHQGQGMNARKRWIAGQIQSRGKLWLDAGAVKVLRERGTSLLPVGVFNVEGEFARGDLVTCVSPEGEDIAKGLVCHPAGTARSLLGLSSSHVSERLGYGAEVELIHRDNLVLLG